MTLFLTFLITSGLFSQTKELVYENKTYEPEIKTVQLYSFRNGPRDNLLPAVTPIQLNDLVLEFDDLRNDINRYYARLVHCNYDWRPSQLRDLDFMTEYNEFNISDYAYSNNTYIPYVHYRFKIPKVKLPGNYLLVVYRDGNKSDLVLSHRFMIYDNRTSLQLDNQSQGAISLRSTNQQLNFIVNYKGLEIVNPFESVHVVIRQNQRWDNAKVNVKPSFVREDIKQIEYRLFDDDKYFSAGNEFRFVDFRSLNFPGRNTGRIDKTAKPFHLWVAKDKNRTNEVYAQYPDVNGNYYIENLDYNEAAITSSYINVTFTLQDQELTAADVYVVGAFNFWKQNEETKMKYDPGQGAYQYTTLLKQGWYNYEYLVKSENLPPLYLEGSHYETENLYEVLFYYRPFQPHADLLVGYSTIPINQR